MAYQGTKFTCTVYFETPEEAEEALNEMPNWHAPGSADGAEFVWGEFGGGQVEICPTTFRPHLQMWIGFTKNKRLNLDNPNNFFKRLHPTAHWELMKGTVVQNKAYCSKHDTSISEYITWGNVPEERPGKRTDLDAMAETMVSAGGSAANMVRAAAQQHGGSFIRYASGVERYAKVMQKRPEVAARPWKIWQTQLLAHLETEPDDRTIRWYYDPAGGAGKSTIIKYLVANKGATLLDGKLADMQHMYVEAGMPRIVFFDLVRTMPDNLDHIYRMAEMLKNGVISSPKYQSVGGVVFDSPHVVIMSNSLPQAGKWTADRLQQIDLSVDADGFAPVSAPANGGAGAPADGADPFYGMTFSLLDD